MSLALEVRDLLTRVYGCQGLTAPAFSDAAIGVALLEAKAHRFSSTQFDLASAGYPRSQGSPLSLLQQLAQSIADSDLADDGRESEFHITVKYGLHTQNAEDVRRVVRGFGGVHVRLGKVSLFPASESHPYEVVKIDVESPDLHRLNSLLSDALRHTDTHPLYQPHITLAYVKPGRGRRYAGDISLSGSVLHLNDLIFSDQDGARTVIDLTGAVPEAAGTCKPGERSDLTGCAPATADPKADKPAEKDTDTPAAPPPKTATERMGRTSDAFNSEVDSLHRRVRAGEITPEQAQTLATAAGEKAVKRATTLAATNYQELKTFATEKFGDNPKTHAALDVARDTMRDARDEYARMVAFRRDNAADQADRATRDDHRDVVRKEGYSLAYTVSVKAGRKLVDTLRGQRTREAVEAFEAAGTCKPGERADLTGCAPATKDAPAQKSGGQEQPTDTTAKAPKAEHLETNKKAKAKIAAAPVPSREDVAKARAELAAAKRGEGRAGGDSRGGSAASRRKQRENLFNEFGGAERGYVVCHATGIKMHWTDDPKINTKGYPKFERGKIFVKCQGGGYQLSNLLPESFAANRSRNDQRLRAENAKGC